MDQVHFVRVPCQEIRFLSRGIASAHDGDRLLLEERAVANRAIGDALPRELQLTGNPQLHRSTTRRDDDCGRPIDVALTRLGVELPVIAFADRGHMHAVPEVGAEFDRVRLEFFRELVSEDTLEAGIVFDELRVE